LATTEQIYEQIGRTIRVRRKKIDITQEELAQRINLTRTSITNIERGRQKFQIHTLFDIARALDVPPAALLPTVEAQASDKVRDHMRKLRPDEREFAKSVLASKQE
jgi:transcriptional regulator with XRE-family HTH domain